MWYFAYGSMVNPVSLRRRGLHPLTSQPARLDGYELKFNAYSGMANVERAQDSSVHGVLHELTEAEFTRLAELERGYFPEKLPVVPYSAELEDFAPIVANVFIFDPEHASANAATPPERYINIIKQGLRHFGAHPGWIRRIEQVPFKPARTPDQYLRIPPASSAELPQWTSEELARHQGRLPAVFAIGSKVIEVDVSANPTDKQVDVLVHMMTGKEVAFFLCSGIHDPSLPEVDRAEDLTDAHRAWVEDLLVEQFAERRFLFRHIGWLEPG